MNYIVLSIFVHSLFFSTMSILMKGHDKVEKREAITMTIIDNKTGKDKEDNKGDNKNIMPKPPNMVENKPTPTESKPKKVIDKEGDTLKQVLVDSEKSGYECEKWYGGIGINSKRLSPTQEQISNVVDDYPADEAGLKVGDIITPYGEIRGEPGTSITMIVRRHDQNTEITIVREKICTDQ